jgi:hypothetical protein
LAKLYWNTDRTQHTSSSNIRALYENFVNEVEGKSYDELSDEAKKIYNKTSDYFTQLTTPLNFLGLLQTELDDNGHRIVVANKFYRKNITDIKFSEIFLDYYLCYWQYPRHNNNDDREIEKRKPYLLILELLKRMANRDINSAYFTKQEFFHLFDNDTTPYLTYTDIDEELVTKLLENGRSWGSGQTDVSDNTLSYDKALLKNSSLLSFNEQDYGSPNEFCFGLSKAPSTSDKLKWILSSSLKNDIFDFNPATSARDKDVINDWANFITDENRFDRWFKAMSISEFSEYCSEKGFQFSHDLIRRFILSLETKPFLLLTGISGSGKTKIAELYGNFLNANSRGGKYILAIGSNWNDGKKLLGFNNPLQPNPDLAYIETDLVKFIKKANENSDKTFIVILDEMNLSYTEKYFSDFLSALESLDNKIILPNGKSIVWSKNIKIIGTINEDETTHTISPKILDRANVIEMNGLIPSDYIDMQIVSEDDIYKTFAENYNIDDYKTLLNKIHTALNGNFAFRIMNEITLYININKAHNTDANIHSLLDEQIYQKILPKIHGSKLDLPKKLNELKTVLDGTEKEYPLTNNKIENMLNHVSTHGYASFIMG